MSTRARPIAIADTDGHMWTRGLSLSDNDTQFVIDASVKPTRDGYLKANARIARVGLQKYRGYEVGLPDRDSVILYRPAEEVFAADSMRSHANKPVTLTHPPAMVDSTTWGKVARGMSGEDVVRDGEYVRVPLMLTDAAAIDAYQKGSARELSVGYTTDLDWTPGTTPEGEAYDGVQRDIRTNHHALVPVARGGANLRFGDAGTCQHGNDPTDCADCASMMDAAAKEILPGDRQSQAAERGISRSNVMPISKMFDGVPIQFADDVSAGAMTTHCARLQKLADDAAASKAKSDADEIEAKRKQVTAEDAFKKEIGVKDGEIAVLKKQLTDATLSDAQISQRAAELVRVFDSAKAILPKDYAMADKSAHDIRRAAVGAQMGDAEIKDWDNAKIEGAFETLIRSGVKGNGAAKLADGLSRGMAETDKRGMGGDARSLADAEKDAAAAYAEYVKDLQDGYKTPISTTRN